MGKYKVLAWLIMLVMAIALIVLPCLVTEQLDQRFHLIKNEQNIFMRWFIGVLFIVFIGINLYVVFLMLNGIQKEIYNRIRRGK